MSVHTPDVGTVSLTAGGTTAVVTTAGGMVGWVNDNALYIGIGLSIISIVIGVIFKILTMVQNERHHKEELRAELEQNAKAHDMLRAELIEEIRRVNHDV